MSELRKYNKQVADIEREREIVVNDARREHKEKIRHWTNVILTIIGIVIALVFGVWR
jgi:t-SNARE complex subunit (syntaxin)